MMQYDIELAIPPMELLRLYRGHAKNVMANSLCGKRVRFPAAHLRRFVDANGVYGRFVLWVDRNNSLVEIMRYE